MAGCVCGKGLRFAFQELNADTKPFLQLSSCSDAQLLVDALTIARCACGQILGCRTSSVCTSIADMQQWTNDASFIPCLEVGRAVSLLMCSDASCNDVEICFDGQNFFDVSTV